MNGLQKWTAEAQAMFLSYLSTASDSDKAEVLAKIQDPGNDASIPELLSQASAALTFIKQDHRNPQQEALLQQAQALVTQGHTALQTAGLIPSGASSSCNASSPRPNDSTSGTSSRSATSSTTHSSNNSATHSSRNTPTRSSSTVRRSSATSTSSASTGTGTSTSMDSRKCSEAALRKGAAAAAETSSSSGSRHAPAPGLSKNSTSSTRTTTSQNQVQGMNSPHGVAGTGRDAILDESISPVCCSACRCDGCASRELQSAHKMFHGSEPFFKAVGLPHMKPGPEAGVGFMSKLLPVLAARLFDPAGGHKLAAAQDALQVLQRHVVLPITSSTGSTESALGAADSKKWALNVALAASRSGLLKHLHQHLESLHAQLQSRELQSSRASSNAGSTSSAVPYSSTDEDTAGSSQPVLAQLLLVYQWTAALCRIWPSSIPDAAPLRSLLSSALGVSLKLPARVSQLPHMQAGMALRTGSGISSAATGADNSSGAAQSSKQTTQLAVPVTAAVLEVAGLVLEPLGLVLHQQQEAERQGSQPPSLSVPAKQLCAELQADALQLLQAMLTVCLHQLVLHAERKHGTSTHAPANPALASSLQQQGGIFRPTASCAAASGGSKSRSTAQLAEGYLLQHADTLQAKQPAAPSRAAVAAWRAVCQRQWADMSLPLTLQEAAAVLASVQPSAAAANSSGNGSSALSAAAGAVWAMQECGTLGGHFRLFGQGLGADTPAASTNSNSRIHYSSSSDVANKGPSSQNASSMAGSTSTSGCDSSGSAGSEPRLPAALGSDPMLSIESCVHKATALSALCRHLAMTKKITNGTDSSRCGLAYTLLATAAAAASLQGAAALPLVRSAAFAVAALLLPIVTCDKSATVRQGTAAPSASSGVAGLAAAPVRGQEAWLPCLCLAAHLATAVLRLERQSAAQPGGTQSEYHGPSVGLVYARLLLGLLEQLNGEQACNTDTALRLRQLEGAAYALQLFEAATRHEAGRLNVEAAVQHGRLPQHDKQALLVIKMCYRHAVMVARKALSLACAAGQAVLGSVQGQLLLQSCTSLLLTCNSMNLGWGTTFIDSAPEIVNLRLCAQQLQLLLLAEAQAVSCGSSSGMSQSLAAGLNLAGRCLIALGTPLSPDRSVDTSSSSSSSSRTSSSLEGRDMVMGLSVDILLKASAGLGCFEIPDDQSLQRVGEQARMVQQAVIDLLGCVQSVNKALQQQADPATSATQLAGSRQKPFAQMTSNRAGSTSSMEGHCAGDDVQHCGSDQQQQAAPGWLLAGMDAAQAALEAVSPPLATALAPYLQHGGSPAPEASSACISSLPAALVAAGEALCAAVPSSACCNNPRCINLSGVSAGFALVRGKGCVCGGCLGLQAGGEPAVPTQGAPVNAARYCSCECQAAHRQQHKGLCSKLAQEAAARTVEQ